MSAEIVSRRDTAPASLIGNKDTGTIPRPNHLGFAGVHVFPDGTMHLGMLNHVRSAALPPSEPVDIHTLPDKLRSLGELVDVRRVVAAGVSGEPLSDHKANHQRGNAIRRVLWQNGIVPHDISHEQFRNGLTEEDNDLSLKMAEYTKGKFTEHGTAIIDVDPETGKVTPSRIATLEDYREAYQEVGHEDVWNEGMAAIDHFADRFSGWKLVRINTTAQAGGVAGMLHPAVRFIEEYNREQALKEQNGETGHPFDFDWYTMNGDIDPQIAAEHGLDLSSSHIIEEYGNPEDPTEPINVFKITKKFHNILQGQERPGEEITETDKLVHKVWSETQARRLDNVLQQENTVFWIDDQQPVGLIQHILRHNPEAPILERLHIQVRNDLARDPDSQQRKVLDFLLGQMVEDGNRIDAFLSHRSREADIDGFLPRDTNGDIDPRIADKVMYKVATADQIDGLGKKLTPEEKGYYLDEANEYLIADGQTPLNLEVGHIGQFARWDRAKNYDGAIKEYALFVDMMLAKGVPLEEIPEQILAGFGAIDDPDGAAVLAENKLLVAEKYPHLTDKIKMFRFTYDRYSDKSMRALEEITDFGEQLSTAEGCEDKITQLLDIGIPMAVADIGGMPPQIVDGVSGHLIDPYQSGQVADHLFTYFTQVYPDAQKRAEASLQARRNVNQEYTTLANVRDMVGIATLLKENREQIPSLVEAKLGDYGRHPFVKEVIMDAYSQEEKSSSEEPHVVFTMA